MIILTQRIGIGRQVGTWSISLRAFCYTYLPHLGLEQHHLPSTERMLLCRSLRGINKRIDFHHLGIDM